MRRILVLLVLGACGPDEELLDELARLQVEVADQKKVKDRLERELAGERRRIEGLEKQLRRYRAQDLLAELGAPRGGSLGAVIRTSKGDIRCDLWPEVARNTVENFVRLAEGTKVWVDPRTGREAERPLYSGTTFHRVIPGFMIQGGDPLGNGTGGPGYVFEDEITSAVGFDRPGLLAMANSGPDTNGSQFFVTLGRPDHLKGKHTIFGDCSDSLTVAEAIAAVPRDASDKPLEPVVIRRVVVERRGP